jgi:hypothetical protein
VKAKGINQTTRDNKDTLELLPKAFSHRVLFGAWTRSAGFRVGVLPLLGFMEELGKAGRRIALGLDAKQEASTVLQNFIGFMTVLITFLQVKIKNVRTTVVEDLDIPPRPKVLLLDCPGSQRRD